jgi:hypothetical protein
MSEEALIRAFAASVIELDAPEAVKADVRGFFARHGVPAEVAATLPAVAAERLAVYRAMVHGRLRDAVADFLPKTAARLPASAVRGCAGRSRNSSPRRPRRRRTSGR